jgi:hypothetical protein
MATNGVKETKAFMTGFDLGDPGVDGRIILRWIFGKWDGRT